jgi:hypothetical protein
MSLTERQSGTLPGWIDDSIAPFLVPTGKLVVFRSAADPPQQDSPQRSTGNFNLYDFDGQQDKVTGPPEPRLYSSVLMTKAKQPLYVCSLVMYRPVTVMVSSASPAGGLCTYLPPADIEFQVERGNRSGNNDLSNDSGALLVDDGSNASPAGTGLSSETSAPSTSDGEKESEAETEYNLSTIRSKLTSFFMTAFTSTRSKTIIPGDSTDCSGVNSAPSASASSSALSNQIYCEDDTEPTVRSMSACEPGMEAHEEKESIREDVDGDAISTDALALSCDVTKSRGILLSANSSPLTAENTSFNFTNEDVVGAADAGDADSVDCVCAPMVVSRRVIRSLSMSS